MIDNIELKLEYDRIIKTLRYGSTKYRKQGDYDRAIYYAKWFTNLGVDNAHQLLDNYIQNHPANDDTKLMSRGYLGMMANNLAILNCIGNQNDVWYPLRK